LTCSCWEWSRRRGDLGAAVVGHVQASVWGRMAAGRATSSNLGV
jgi:hypothetical protein